MKAISESIKVRSSIDLKKISLKEKLKARLGFRFLEYKGRKYIRMNPDRFPAGQFLFSHIIRGIFDTPQILKFGKSYYIEYIDEECADKAFSASEEGKDLRAEQFILARIFKDPDHYGDNTVLLGSGKGSAVFDLEFMPIFFMENPQVRTDVGSWSLQEALMLRTDKYSERLRSLYNSSGPFSGEIKKTIAEFGHRMHDGSKPDPYSYLWVATEKAIVGKLNHRFIQEDGKAYILYILKKYGLQLDEIMYFAPEQLSAAPKSKSERNKYFTNLLFSVLQRRILYYQKYYSDVRS